MTNKTVIFVLLIAITLGSYFYKSVQQDKFYHKIKEQNKQIIQLDEVVSLQKIWSPKNTKKDLKKLKQIIKPEKVKWVQSSHKLEVKYSNLDAKELNKILNKILNTAIQIKDLKIYQKDDKYNMEILSKW